MPLILDTSKTIEGTLDLQNDVAGTGQVTLDFTMEALVGGDGVIVGTDSETVLVTPAASDYPVTFHVTPNATLEKALISGIDLNVYIHGAYADSGYIGNSGKSFLTVGSFSCKPGPGGSDLDGRPELHEPRGDDAQLVGDGVQHDRPAPGDRQAHRLRPRHPGLRHVAGRVLDVHRQAVARKEQRR